jgi:DNA replication initiation complex subunit (GINS family)
MPLKIKNLDFCFENALVRIIADRNHEIHYWIAQELAEAGIVHFREDDCLDATKLYKIQWKERVQIAGQISELTEDFYPKLRRYLANIKAEITKHPEKVQEYEKATHLSWDIVNSRLKKIVALSSGPLQTEQTLKKFTSEERFIYEQLSKIINEWKAQIIGLEGENRAE